MHDAKIPGPPLGKNERGQKCFVITFSSAQYVPRTRARNQLYPHREDSKETKFTWIGSQRYIRNPFTIENG